MELQTIDKDAKTWFINTGAYRMNDPTTGHNFEPGIKYRIKESVWMTGQPTIVETDMDLEHEIQVPKQPRGPRVDRNEKFVESTAAKV